MNARKTHGSCGTACIKHARMIGCAPAGERGFSLMELIMVIILTGIVFTIGGMALHVSFQSYFLARDVTDADWQARVALERMAREMRAVRSATTADVDISPTTQIQFFDTDGNGVCFYRSSTTLMRSADGPGTACGTTASQPLADNVTAMSLSYWDNAGATTATETSVYYATVQITVADGDYTGTFRTNVWPRNF